MKKYINIICIVLTLFFVTTLTAQSKAKNDTKTKVDTSITGQKGDVSTKSKKSNKEKHKITAQVVDENNKPLMGAIVTANEGADNVTTDADGKFTIELKAGSKIVVENIGYSKQTINEISIMQNDNKIKMIIEKISGIDGNVELPYQVIKKMRTSSSVTSIDPNKELDRDTRFDISTAINGKISGTLGAYNIHGMGTSAIFVDGVKRDATYLNMQEIESITVLKDAVSRMLYGAEADQGVILITTKKGEADKKIMKFNVEQGIQKALSYPKFLDAAGYMTAYNKAAQNDGALPYSKYTQLQIENTANKVDPVLYPDNNYYSNDYVKNTTTFTNIYGELSGGNEKTQYFMNLGLKHNDGWIKMGNNDQQNILNFRGKVNFNVNSWLSMNAEVVTVFDISSSPNVNTYNTNTGALTASFWTKASTYLPNTQALLIPITRLTNATEILSSSLIEGQYILGGSGVYTSSLYGDLTRSGSDTQINRFTQFNTGFDLNLSSITKGLSGKGLLSLNFTNKYHQSVINSYAVYQMGLVGTDGNFPVTRIGVDNITGSQSIDQATMYFDRLLTGYMSLNYNRTFGRHAVSAVLMSSVKDYTEMDQFQDTKRVNIGFQANYMYNDRYCVDFGLLNQGSSKLPTNKKFGIAPTGGVAWIVSNEDFLKDSKTINYLKLRSTYGVLQNDNWTLGAYDGYFLYQPTYTSGSNFTYGNGSQINSQKLISSLGNVITWQTRSELNIGFDASLFNNRTWIEGSYFNSKNGNIMTQITNTPATIGSVPKFENYNTTVYKGFEVSIKHTEKLGKITATLGANYTYTTSEITKIDEPVYNLPTNMNLEKVGTRANALWGLSADGLYMPTDFDSNGKLLSTLPTPTYGSVKPGDIKYLSINGDNIIDANDYKVLGVAANNQQYSFDIDIKYSNWQFYVLGIGQTGGKGFTNSDYYWFKGNNAKYSEVALNAFDPLNPDPNATYPRLTLTNGTNNYINSSFWMYDKSYFSIAAAQLAYNFKFRNRAFVKELKIYSRGSNLITVAKDLKIQRLNYQNTPQSRVLSLGLIASF